MSAGWRTGTKAAQKGTRSMCEGKRWATLRRVEPLLSHKMHTDWATPQQDVLAFELGTEQMTILLAARKVRELPELLGEWPEGKRTAAVREMKLSKLHVNGQEKGAGRARRVPEARNQTRVRKKAQARRVLVLKEDFMEYVGWCRWCA